MIIPEGLENIYTNNGWIGFKSIANNATLTTTNVELLKNTSIYTLDAHTLRVSSFPISNKNTLLIYTIQGKHIFTTSFSSNGATKDINIPILKSGIYVIQIQSALGSLTKKISILE